LAFAGLLGLCCWLTGPEQALAADAESAYRSAAQEVRAASSELGAVEAAVKRSVAEERSAAQQLADAALLMGAKDYARAIDVLNGVVEKYPNDPAAYSDGLSSLGEAYFQSKQYLSARRIFRRITEQPGDRRFVAYQAKALGRLVDIALRTQDYGSLDAVFASMSQVPPAAVGSGLAYARGKGLLAKKDNQGAKASLAQVDDKSEFSHQARYLLALIAVNEATPPRQLDADPSAPPPPSPPARYAAAIDLFHKVTQLPADSPEHAQVIDLSWLAIGRLLYETDQWAQAIQAYNHVDRTSPQFGTMLYELAWVYVRLGDVDRAKRALEVLAVTDPSSENIADGALLRADLMLRAGQFEKSLKVYEGVRATYDPMKEKVDAFLGSTSDPAVYYDKLSQEQLEGLDRGSGLPALAIQWAREAEDGPQAFAVIDEVVLCRELIRASNQVIERLNAVLSSPNRVRAFPELQAGEERALTLLNRIALARLSLGRGLDAVDDGALSGELGQARAARRALEKRLALVPATAADFQERELQASRQWNGASQALQRLNLQIDTLQATINGLHRVLRESAQSGVVRDPSSASGFEAELAQHEQELALHKTQLEALRKMVAAGRVQVGFGDQRFVEDAATRKQYRDALVREVELSVAGQGGQGLRDYAQKLAPVLRSADDADARIDGALASLEAVVAQRSGGLAQDVARETGLLIGYQVQLDGLDSQARLVVGEVAMRNFGRVRDRFKTIALRADVGITEEAWEVREEQRTRVRNLQVERAREDRLLKEELREVLDDNGEAEDDRRAKEKKQ
jgi:tetratricopeptide (TPR) repeat protein